MHQLSYGKVFYKTSREKDNFNFGGFRRMKGKMIIVKNYHDMRTEFVKGLKALYRKCEVSESDWCNFEDAIDEMVERLKEEA